MLPITADKTSIMQVKLKNGEDWIVDLSGERLAGISSNAKRYVP